MELHGPVPSPVRRHTDIAKCKLRVSKRPINPEKVFNCGKCPKSFSTSALFHSHLTSHSKKRSTHTNSRPLSPSRSDLSSVVDKDGSPIEPAQPPKLSGRGRSPCPKCDKSFGTINDLKRHASVHDEVRGSTHKCIICPKSFPTTHRLQNHLRYHIKEDPYICYFCPKRFMVSDKLSRHVYSHTGEKPYRCLAPKLTSGWRCTSKKAAADKAALCRNSFISADKLKRHMKRHKK